MMDSSNNQPSNHPGDSVIYKVKGLLTRAWRERWTEVQWGIHLKKCLYSAASTDTKELMGKILCFSSFIVLLGCHGVTHIDHLQHPFCCVNYLQQTFVSFTELQVQVTISGLIVIFLFYDHYSFSMNCKL